MHANSYSRLPQSLRTEMVSSRSAAPADHARASSEAVVAVVENSEAVVVESSVAVAEAVLEAVVPTVAVAQTSHERTRIRPTRSFDDSSKKDSLERSRVVRHLQAQMFSSQSDG